MAINGEHAAIILKRVFDCRDPSEQIVLISGKDKRRIAVHRVILNAASKYFSDVLGPNFQGEKPKESVLDSDGATIETVVNFCYTGNINLTAENAKKCLAIASYAEIDMLEDKCRQYFSTNLSVDSSVSILTIADKYKFGDLRARAFNLICDDFETVPSTEVQKLSHPLLQELLECNKIQECGDLSAKRLLEWFQCDENERGVFMPNLLKLIRLELLTLEFLSDTLEVVLQKFKCSDLVNSEYKRRAIGQRGHITVPDSISPSSGEEEVLPEMKVARAGHTSTSLGKYIYVFGGECESGLLASCERFDTENNSWKTIRSMNVARASPAVTILNGYIYIAGGYTNWLSSGTTTSVELYNPKTDEWANQTPTQVPRNVLTLIETNGVLFAMGGRKRVVERFKPYKNCWETVESFENSNQITSSIEIDDKLFAMMKNGKFGRIDIDEDGNSSFVALSKCNCESEDMRRHFLYEYDI